MTTDDTALIDPERLAELDAMFGSATTEVLLAPMYHELYTAPGTIGDLVAVGQDAAARSAAHGLRGAALGLGCIGVADLCERLEVASAALLPDLAATLGPVAARTAATLRQMRA